MTERSISGPQFFSLLYLAMLGSVFMYISSTQIKIASTDSLLRPLVFILVSIIAIIPSYICIKKETSFKRAHGLQSEGNILYKAVALVYAAVYLLDAIMTASRFDLFASSELFPGTDMTVFIIALVVVCGALALLGIGALARASVIFSIIVVGATVFAMLTLVEEVDFLNFTPVFENGITDFFKDSMIFSVHSSVIGTVLIFSSNIKEKLFKNYVLWAVFSGLTFCFILFFVVGTLGLFADTQLFPTYAAVTLAEFGLLERLDALETAIWILCIVSKLTFYMIIIIKSVCYAFPRVQKGVVSAVATIVISAVLVFISGDITRFGFVSYMPLITVVYIVPVIILPFILLAGNVIKRRKHNEKTN